LIINGIRQFVPACRENKIRMPGFRSTNPVFYFFHSVAWGDNGAFLFLMDTNRGKGLGYRGFVITVTGADKETSLPSTIRVYKGFVLMDEKVFSDQHSVEKKLIEQARNKGFADIIESIGIKE
jgi:hypothetical protein